jgi:hypothetical protein
MDFNLQMQILKSLDAAVSADVINLVSGINRRQDHRVCKIENYTIKLHFLLCQKVEGMRNYTEGTSITHCHLVYYLLQEY